MRVITGFHAIEEELRALTGTDKGSDKGKKGKPIDGVTLLHSKPGPRVKKMIESAGKIGVPCRLVDEAELNKLVSALPQTSRDHRGVALTKANEEQPAKASFDESVAALAAKETALVVILDSITDPHNVGAIIRSADQFAVDLVVIPENRSATDFEVISRTSAGASSWVNVAITNNLVRAVERLKEAGFWIYGADAGGVAAPDIELASKTALVMGSEGSGIGRLLREKCDRIVSIPTGGKLDSLNVSVAAGVLLYEIRRRNR